MNYKPSISIIIPNWNGKKLLERHLPSVMKASKGHEIIVVDDASTDDSVLFLKNAFPVLRVIQKSLHQGFSSTVNEGVRHATGDIVVLLNSDVEPEKNFLEPLIPHFSDEKVFAVGCMDKSVEHGKIVCRGRGVAFWRKGMFLHKRGEIDKFDTAWVSGGSGAFRKTYWIKLGGMDERFNPFYWEDIDLSYRARKSGFILLFEPKSVVIHKHEEGVIKQMMTEHYVRRIAYRNQLLCIWKNITDISYVLEHIFYLHIRLLQSFFKHDNSFIRAYVDALFFLPSTIRERNNIRKMFILKDRDILTRD